LGWAKASEGRLYATAIDDVLGGFGYRAGGLCLPPGNYHNIGPGQRPGAEYVSVSDLEQLVTLTVTAAGEWTVASATRLRAMVQRRVLSIARTAPRKLAKL